MNRRDQVHLKFIYDRLVYHHGENPNYDYILRLKEIIGDIPGPQTAPSNHSKVMQLRQEHLKALDYVAKNAGRAHDIIPDNHALNVRLAEEAVQIIKEVFGASSTSYITLYPTMG